MVSTELALLQSNMTFMYKKCGLQYHWVVELFRRLKLTVFDGVRAALEEFNELRKKDSDCKKTDRYKKGKTWLKVERTKDAQCRKAWSKKHGYDTYGDDNSDDDDLELKPEVSKRHRKGPRSAGGKCKHVAPLLTSALTTGNAPSTRKERMVLQLHSMKMT